MTKIEFYRDDGVLFGFRESGHTGFAESGEDVLCASISSMTMLLINTIEDCFGAHIDYDINEDDTVVTCKSSGALPEFEEDERIRFSVAGMFQGYYETLQLLVEDNYEYLEVNIKDAEYDEI